MHDANLGVAWNCFYLPFEVALMVIFMNKLNKLELDSKLVRISQRENKINVTLMNMKNLVLGYKIKNEKYNDVNRQKKTKALTNLL